MHRARLPYLLIPLAAFLAIIPLLINGCSCGHDFDFHLLNWMEAARQFTHGNLHPHWAYTAAWNAGEPRFVFYPPLSWTIGAILGLILPWTWTPILYTWLALTAAGLSLHYLARRFHHPNRSHARRDPLHGEPLHALHRLRAHRLRRTPRRGLHPTPAPRHPATTDHHPTHSHPHRAPLAHQRPRSRHELLRPRSPGRRSTSHKAWRPISRVS